MTVHDEMLEELIDKLAPLVQIFGTESIREACDRLDKIADEDVDA